MRPKLTNEEKESPGTIADRKSIFTNDTNRTNQMEQPEVLKTLIAIAQDFQKINTSPELEEQKQQINQMIDKAINIAMNCLLINKPKYEKGMNVTGTRIEMTLNGMKVRKVKGKVKLVEPVGMPFSCYKYIIQDDITGYIETLSEEQIDGAQSPLKLHKETDDLHNTD